MILKIMAIKTVRPVASLTSTFQNAISTASSKA